MNQKTTPILVVLLVIAAFLVGMFWTKVQYLEGNSQGGGTTKGVQASPKPTPVPFTAKKTAKPQVKFFVMAYCPYGIQAEKGLEPVYQLLKNKVDWQPRYVIYKDYCTNASAEQQAQCEKSNCLKEGDQTYCSMHGLAELNQDLRELCAFKIGDLDKWWKFVSLKNENCTVSDVETCWQEQALAAGLDTAQITSCLASEKWDLIKEQLAEMSKYKATGSPMVFINDVLYNGGRAPEDYKKAICESFSDQPAECQQVLGAESEAAAGGCQ